MTQEFTPIPFDDVQKKFGDCSIFDADEELLKRCLAGSTRAPSEKERQIADQMSETIRHLIFMKQTQRIQNESAFVAKVALFVAVVAAVGALVQALASILGILCHR